MSWAGTPRIVNESLPLVGWEKIAFAPAFPLYSAVSMSDGPADLSKHSQIREYLLSRIRRGLLATGEKIPSEYTLAKRFQVNKTTANKAVSTLVADGFLTRRKGAGTFVANQFARVTPTIGFYTSLRHSSYFTHLLIGAEEEAVARGYSLIFFQFPGWGAETDMDKFWKYIASTGVKGLIINRPFQQPLDQIPTLFLDTTVPSEDVDQVQVDSEHGGRILAEHFLAYGHKQVAFISQDTSRKDLLARAKGFLAVFQKHGLSDSAERLHVFSPAQHNLLTVLRRLVQSDPRITGIAFDSDHVALQAITILQKLDKWVPGRISVAGFGNTTVKGDPVRLTSIEQHPLTLGHLAAEALIDRIEGRQKGRVKILSPVELVKGETVAVIRD